MAGYSPLLKSLCRAGQGTVTPVDPGLLVLDPSLQNELFQLHMTPSPPSSRKRLATKGALMSGALHGNEAQPGQQIAF